MANVKLEAMGFERAPFLAALLSCAYSVLQLRLPSSQHFCLKMHEMTGVIEGAVRIIKQLHVRASREHSARSRPSTPAPDSTKDTPSELDKGVDSDPAKDNLNLDITAVATAFLQHKYRILGAEEFAQALEAARHVFGDADIDFAQIEAQFIVDVDSVFSRQVKSVIGGMRQIATPTFTFIHKCTALMDCLKCDARPVILVGAPQTGKSHCIKIVSRALTIDLDNPVKDALPKTATKFVAPVAYFSVPTDTPAYEDAEVFDHRSIAQLYDYVEWFGKLPVNHDFTFSSRWLIMDCPDAQSIDGIATYSYQRTQQLQVGLANVQWPVLFIETCSLQNAAPSPLASSHIVYFTSDCLGWREIFEEWAQQLTLKLEKRTLQEITDLVANHVPEMVAFLKTECKTILPVSSVRMIRSFCDIMHYHFFLGKDVAMRRTIGFVRANFVFACVWSFGAFLDKESKDKFDPWFRSRIEKAKLLRFPFVESEDHTPDLWEIHVSFHTMSLRCFSETDAEFQADQQAAAAVENTLVIPFLQLRMAHLLWQIFHTQHSHTLFYAPEGGGKTRLLDWIFQIHNKHDAGWNFGQVSMQQNRSTAHLRRWLAESLTIRPDKLFAKHEYNGFFIDDVHLALESPKQPTAMAELLRSMMERKGALQCVAVCCSVLQCVAVCRIAGVCMNDHITPIHVCATHTHTRVLHTHTRVCDICQVTHSGAHLGENDLFHLC